MRYIYLKKAQLTLTNEKGLVHYHYKIADSIYQSDHNIQGLEYLIQPCESDSNIKPDYAKPQNKEYFNLLIHDELTPIGDKNYCLNVQYNPNYGYCVEVNEQIFYISKNQILANISDIDIRVLLGPVIILNLALNQIFCLHASAFFINKTVFILMANSGTGKSSIARFMNRQANCKRICDDILPVNIINNNINVLTNFPQLKLTQNQQDQHYMGDDNQQKTILLYVDKSVNETTIVNIDEFTSMKKLINHSVATKLFSSNELHNHLLFSQKISQFSQSYQVNYQHTKDSLQQLYQLLYEIH